jgi:hypothetical protein
MFTKEETHRTHIILQSFVVKPIQGFELFTLALMQIRLPTTDEKNFVQSHLCGDCCRCSAGGALLATASFGYY